MTAGPRIRVSKWFSIWRWWCTERHCFSAAYDFSAAAAADAGRCHLRESHGVKP